MGSADNPLDYGVDLARTAEGGLFDGVFLADVLGQDDVDGGSADAALARAAQAPNVDLVVPELQARGAFKTQPADGTLRE